MLARIPAYAGMTKIESWHRFYGDAQEDSGQWQAHSNSNSFHLNAS